MIVVAWVPLLVAVLAAILYLVVSRADVKQLALVTFLAAMIAFMFALSGHTARFSF